MHPDWANWKMVEIGFDKSEVKELKLKRKDDIIHASFKIECYQQEDVIEVKIIELDFVLKQIGNKIYIDGINGNLSGIDKT